MKYPPLSKKKDHPTETTGAPERERGRETANIKIIPDYVPQSHTN